MYANKNNLKSELASNVWVLDTTISITSGEWILRESDMVACLEHYDNDICTKREIVKITAISDDTFTIERWFAECIMNDETKEQWQSSNSFNVWDFLSLYFNKELRESLVEWMPINEENLWIMLAKIEAPRNCIEWNCQLWKTAIDSAYVSKYWWNAWFWTGADWDCVIESDEILCASCEYNFNNLTICPNVTVRFCGIWVPTINVRNNFINCWTIDMRSPYLEARNTQQTDCRMFWGCALSNSSSNLSWIASEWWCFCGWASRQSWRNWYGASDWHWWNGGNYWWAWTCYCWMNGWNGGNSGSDRYDSWAWWWWAYLFGRWWNGGNGNAYWWDGWHWYYGWNGGDKNGACTGGWWNGGNWVIRWWDAWGWRASQDYTEIWRWWNWITNVYWLHLNARYIWNNCINSKWWDWWDGWHNCWYWSSWWYSPSWWNGGNWANWWQIMVSYKNIYIQWCFDVRGWQWWKWWWVKFSSEDRCRYVMPDGNNWTNWWVVFRNLDNAYIENFILENDTINSSILISWTDPQLNADSEKQWTKTVVRYSTSNYPNTPISWNLAIEETTINQYQTTPYALTWLISWTTYYFSIFALDQNNNLIDVKSSKITPIFNWKPWINTIAYYPLETNSNDYWQNQLNLTNSGVEFVSLYDVRCAYFNWNSFLSYNDNLILWNSAFTVSCWVYFTTDSNSWQNIIAFWNTGSNYAFSMWIHGSYDKKNNLMVWWWNNDRDTWYVLPKNQWLNIVMIHSWWTIKTFVNGALVNTATVSYNIYNTKTRIWCWLSSDWDKYFWYIWQVIQEEIARTDNEVIDYFNITKKYFWLE